MKILLNQRQIEQFMKYKQFLLEWNQKINLTAITEDREIILKHFVDCISIISVMPFPKSASVIDVGTGAGFPGIPLKIVCPEIQMTLLDSLQKRLIFLQEVIQQLALSKISCVHSRAEDGGKQKEYRENYDYCVSRAVANLAVLCEYCCFQRARCRTRSTTISKSNQSIRWRSNRNKTNCNSQYRVTT